MIPFRKTVLATVIGSGLSAASPAFADDTTQAALRQLIEQQAEQIRQLERRLAAVESTRAAPAAQNPPAAQAAAVATDSSAQQRQLDALQAQLTQLAAGSDGGIRWTDGMPQFRSADGFFTFQPKLRVLLDYSSTQGSDYDARNISGTEGRDLRLGGEGAIGKLGYKLDVDFSSQATAVKDVWLSYNSSLFGVPAEYTLGNKLKDRGTEGATSQTRVPFMERNAVAAIGQGVNGSYGLGGFLRLYGEGWHLGLSVTGDDLSSPGTASDSVMYSVRAHWNPWSGRDGFVHVGGWYWYETIGSDIATLDSAPRIAQNFNDNLRVAGSAIIDPTRDQAHGYELGGVYRSLWTLGEYVQRTTDAAAGGSSADTASSIAAGWLLTGEKPGFSKRTGLWGSTKVRDPATSGGWGAWELALRFDRYDLRERPQGGDGHSLTLGLNWYLNDWSRLMLNYVDWNTDNRSGSFTGPDTGRSIGLRTQVAF